MHSARVPGKCGRVVNSACSDVCRYDRRHRGVSLPAPLISRSEVATASQAMVTLVSRCVAPHARRPMRRAAALSLGLGFGTSL